MNNRDPFGLRPSIAPRNAFTLLQQSAARNAQKYSKQFVEHGQHALERGQQAFEDGIDAIEPHRQAIETALSTAAQEAMSFAVPRTQPDFEHPQRPQEDSAWGSSSRARFPDNNAGVSERIGGMFGTGEKELPMYKDKPYNYAASGKGAPWFKRRRIQALLLLGLITVLYWLGIFSSSDRESSKDTPSASSLWKNMFASRPPAAVDWAERQDRVRDAFKLSWDAYEKYAWGYDVFHPKSRNGRQMVEGGMGWIIVDALDTLILMNLTTQLTHAREWVSTALTYEKDHDVNTFETTIRMLGGLLSAHYLTTEFPDYAPIPMVKGSADEDLFLEKATDLADRLLGAYESRSGIPYASINLKTMEGIKSHADMGASSTAEATTLQLEMKYVAKLTGEANYWKKAEKVMQVVDDLAPTDGLVPIFVQPESGRFQGDNIRLGSRGDSYYEYLIKQYLQTAKQEPVYLDMWDESVMGVRKHLITYSYPSNFTVLAERPNGLDSALSPKMDHLVCFMPGTIALGATEGLTVEEARKSSKWGAKQEADMQLAEELMKTCWGMYKATATGLAPEITYFKTWDPPHMWADYSSADLPTSPASFSPAPDAPWKEDFVIKPADTHNLQRPESAESLFYMYRITRDVRYREWGWEMFQAFVKHTLLEDGSGFTSLGDVTTVPPSMRDNMESFWMAETLKYLFLLFGDEDVLPLDKVVFNTEAHPFPTFEMGKLFKTGWERKPRKQQ
ncbi:glycoside hydrolase family 47 protein [Aplosporella prunicola CBS 121167]|uniref:alpha-1,2-Mannosidase n=1 Tax=Aplosporella prunicola CBS 121167 TaxID=1176127 RepID=A0A6A6BFS6_9PEZI|nr:glycoside hydrolase family 47 protein [Aplosporella prunicola CBS 121167]KAF2142253.1 glycoside hydrolase family 47 protein [Aplosporella prunicola CBS 121167]